MTKYVSKLAQAVHDLSLYQFPDFKFFLDVWAEAMEHGSNKSPLKLPQDLTSFPSFFEAAAGKVEKTSGPNMRRKALTELMALCACWITTSRRVGEDLKQ